MDKHTTAHLLMIRPVHFAYNAQTAVNNAFQEKQDNQEAVQKAALQEFDGFVEKLRAHGVEVRVISDTPEPHTPDSIFPNNWISFHSDGKVVLYPMFAENRRLERRPEIIEEIKKDFKVTNIIDLSEPEKNERFLEGTGSMVLDRAHKLCYACLSPRTNEGLLKNWCQQMGYTPVTFHAVDAHGVEIYHTNVLMAVAEQFVAVCLQAIANPTEKEMVVNTIEKSGKQVVEISLDQMNNFCGNMLQVENTAGERLTVMSSRAWENLTDTQLKTIESFNRIVHSDLHTIETNGGGSARCMMAEVHLPKNHLTP